MNCVETAKMIREVLKKEFPFVKFSVRSSRYSGGSSVSVSWTDFPTQSTIDNLVKKYARVHYDEYTGEILSGGNMFVSCSNDWTKETRELIENTMLEKYGESYLSDHWGNMRAYNDTAEELSNKWVEEQKAKLQPKKAAKKVVKVETVQNNQMETITCTMNLNNDLNGVELKFSGIPTEAVRTELKAQGWKWSKFNKVWYCKQSPESIMFAESLVSIYNDIAADTEELETIQNEINQELEMIEETPAIETKVNETVEAEETQEQPIIEYNKDGKIKVKSIQFIWSESNQIQDGQTVSTFEEAEQIIKNAAFHAPDDGCYDKTKFLLTWSDGQTYEGRIDIIKSYSFKSTPLKDHVTSFAKHVIEDTERDYYTQEQKDNYKQFLETYSLEDDKQETKQPTNGKVLDFSSRFKQRQEKQQTEEMTTHFINNILPYLDQSELNELQQAYSSKDESKLDTVWKKLMLTTAIKRAKEEVLKQN